MSSILPRLEISLSKIQDNTEYLSKLYGGKSISLMGVSKAVLGEPKIIQAMIRGGINFIADSRIENIKKLKRSDIDISFVLLRTAMSEASAIVENVDISFNTEIIVLRELSYHARLQQKTHKVLIMVELGDLREGVMPNDLVSFIKEVLRMSNIKIVGIGSNLACYGGIRPNNKNMNELSKIAKSIEKHFNIKLEIVSGGNSANYDWFQSAANVGAINNLRLGESIFLGTEPLNRNIIPNLHIDAFRLFAEVIESKRKPSLPYGDVCQNGFGATPKFIDRGLMQRSIIALGRQDVHEGKISTVSNLDILGSSSDHIILDSSNVSISIGEEIEFALTYSSLLAVMTSPFVEKYFVEKNNYSTSY